MLSRSSSHPMPLADHTDWDIFCTVIDNFGDIGVCWRLARQLAAEHDLRVRLWVDNLQSFQLLCPKINPQLSIQQVLGVEIRQWSAPFPEVVPGQVVIESFACNIPDGFIAAMVQCAPRPIWINLEYLSAERWVAGCHALPSPHPRLPLTKYFFFPGFTGDTGGLLRENDLLERRQAFESSLALQGEFWSELGFGPPRADALCVSLFAYENSAITNLLSAWETSATPVSCQIPVSRALPEIESLFGRTFSPGDTIQRGALEIRILPFVEQSHYDALLWACDLNFVRGEDSFVRAQWAGRPLVWHIYPQQENVHLDKLEAFLDLYSTGLPTLTADILRSFWRAWNGGQADSERSEIHWGEFSSQLPTLRAHAVLWTKHLTDQEDLSSALVRFTRSKL